MADAVRLHLARLRVDVDVAAQFGDKVGAHTAHGLVHRADAFYHGVVADGTVHRVAVVHVAARLSHMGDEEQVTPAVQLLDKCFVKVAIKRAVTKGGYIHARGEILDPADGLMYGGRREKPQHHADGRHGVFGRLVGLGRIEFRARSTACLRDYDADAALVRTCHVRGHVTHGSHFRGIQHGKRRVLDVERVGNALNGGDVVRAESLVAAPDGHLADAAAGEVLHRLDFGKLVAVRFREDTHVKRYARIDAENLRKLVVQHFHRPTVGLVGDAQRLRRVDGRNGLHMRRLEAVGDFRVSQIGDEARHMVFTRHAFGHIAVLSFYL